MGLSDKFFVDPAKVEEREIELGDGTKEALHFKQLDSVTLERYAMWANSADEEVAASATHRLISMALVEPDGQPAISFEQAKLLKRPIVQRMLAAIFDVNGYGKGKAGNDSPAAPKSGSGTS